MSAGNHQKYQNKKYYTMKTEQRILFLFYIKIFADLWLADYHYSQIRPAAQKTWVLQLKILNKPCTSSLHARARRSSLQLYSHSQYNTFSFSALTSTVISAFTVQSCQLMFHVITNLPEPGAPRLPAPVPLGHNTKCTKCTLTARPMACGPI